MRAYLYRWLLPVGLATATLVGTVSSASAQPAVRDHRRAAPPQASPNKAPPPPRAERQPAPRRGQVWVAGSWNWTNNKWQWTSGRFQRAPAGKRWQNVQWNERNGAWVRFGGAWEDAPQYPDQPPPPPRQERQVKRRGFVWVAGHWDWSNGQWQWTSGRAVRAKAGARWTDGRWDQRDGRWQWNAGQWQEGETRGGAWAFDSRGWSLLGEKTVDGRVDTDQIDFSQKQGKVSRITVVVLDSDLEMIDLRVVYTSGKDLRPTDTQFFREGSRTRVIKLAGSEILRAVQFKYRNLPGGGKARVQVWGNLVK